MKNKILTTTLSVFLLLSAAYSQEPLTIKQIPKADGKSFMHIASYPLVLKGVIEKSMMITIRFTTHDQTGKLSDMMGIDMFAKGLGKCFFKDSLQLKFANGKLLKVAATSPMFCEQPLSAWFGLSKESFTSLFASPLIQVNFINAKSGETFNHDITADDQQQYFIELKKLFDQMVASK